MPNGFSKEEVVAFDQLLEGFQDALVMSKNVAIYRTDQTMMERSNDTIWRPMPYIGVTYPGADATNNFNNYTQLTVPASITTQRHAAWQFTAKELRDALQEQRISASAEQRLASDINQSVIDQASFYGSVFIRRTTAAVGFDDVALIEAAFNESGVSFEDRKLVLSTRDYNGMASDLQKNTRSFGDPISNDAFRRASVGMVASFETFKADYLRRKAAAAGGTGIQISTLDAGLNYWIPKATTAATTGETSNVDNRFQTVTVSTSASVAAGDAFTIANVNRVHMITKEDTGQPMTFRVVSVPAGGTTLVITPPIISNQVANEAAEQYQNCIVTAKSGTAGITFLNTQPAFMNPFWSKDAIEILPGRLAVPNDAGAATMRATTDNGVEIVMSKQFDINTQRTKFRVDTLYGVVNKQPQMSGVIMFGQNP
jgi:P22 coat protein - gene protein 5.